MQYVRPGIESRELVLVGGGHAHIQILRRWAMKPVPGVQLTLVVDRGDAVYSGMVPGFVAGDYSLEEISIDLARLAGRAGAQLIPSAAIEVDPSRHRISFADRPAIFYDVASLDVGSRVLGWRLAGVKQFVLATRPIAKLTQELLGRLSKLRGPGRVCVVGGGPGGVELAFCCQARLAALGLDVGITLVDAASQILDGYPDALRQRTLELAQARDIELRLGRNVVEVREDGVRLETSEVVAADLVLWVAGAAPPALIEDSPLPRDPRGFTLCDDELRVKGHTDLFAVGDCAVQANHPWVPRAGVYAVRQGPVLDHNLRAVLARAPLQSYEPQRDYLSLLNLGGGVALGSKWGRTLEGRWVWRLKDRIDRRFVERFTFADATQEPTATAEMECGGCAAKLGRETLQDALSGMDTEAPDERVIWGIREAEDVAAWKMKDEVVVANVDAFSAFTRDYFALGRVAATNALSDLWAKAALPEVALSSLVIPKADRQKQAATVQQILKGASQVFDAHGVQLLGGHTQAGEQLQVGFAIWGRARGPLLPKRGAQSGDCLVLTKALGSGVLLHADAMGDCRFDWRKELYASLFATNADAGLLAQRLGARAATDITGFGLLGHLHEMLHADGLGAELELSALPVLPGALELLARGYRSTFHAQNSALREWCQRSTREGAVEARTELLFDPQTSGGLLIAISPEQAEELLRQLSSAGLPQARLIGRVKDPGVSLV
ncbi:MAG: selenide, water dikinase SelD [Polyangiaceae bacterium]|nr:selenide, water dikinase SelD [Myxococcales bacterium]MCB9588162.1 selenide, water dikinase SelD [Polyangiaceae bacterium]